MKVTVQDFIKLIIIVISYFQHQTGLSILNIPGTDRDAVYKAEMEAAEKIREALRFIKNQHFEVPFIAFYRKEYVESSLHMSDLWKVYQYDEKVSSKPILFLMFKLDTICTEKISRMHGKLFYLKLNVFCKVK